MSGYVLAIICILFMSQGTSERPRVSLEELHKSFNVQKHRKYEEKILKLKTQDAKIRDAQRLAERLNENFSMSGKRFCNKSEPFPHVQLSYHHLEGLPVIVSSPERAGNAPCSFIGASCGTENAEHLLVDRFVTINDTVLETGARYGTTSCAIAARQLNSGKLVSVEPDYRVWNLLDENRIQHKCNFWLLRGVVAHQPVAIEGTFYSTRTITNNNFDSNTSSIQKRSAWKGRKRSGRPVDRCSWWHQTSDTTDGTQISIKKHYTFEEIQSITKLRFSVILIDCEGCIETLFYGNSGSLSDLLKDVHTIILEADMPIGSPDCTRDCVDYDKWIIKFSEVGLKVLLKNRDPVYPKIYHYVFKRMLEI